MARQKKPKKPRKHEAALEQGFCTGLRCRQYVLSGSGIQVYDEKKSRLDRYCWVCYQKIERDREQETVPKDKHAPVA